MVRRADLTLDLSEFLRIQIAKGTATATLTRADLHNAFNEVMIDKITRALDAL